MSGTFSGVGTLQFTPDNQFAQAVSGDTIVTGSLGSPDTILEFETQSYYLLCKVAWSSLTVGGNDETVGIYFDDNLIFESRYSTGSNTTNDQPLPLIIPPFTNFKFKYGMEASNNATVVLTAKVRGAIEQFNLELKNE